MNSGWVCSMIGAREHYALPRAFDSLGKLHRFYTDSWAGPMLRRLAYRTPGLRSLAGRFHADLPTHRVTSFTATTLYNRLTARQSRSREAEYLNYLRVGRDFAHRVKRHLRQTIEQAPIQGFFGYNTGCLETLKWLKERSVPTIVNQIDPAWVEDAIVRKEVEAWPGWQALPGRIPDIYFEHLQAEWRTADHVVVNSEWSRQALITQKVPAEKIRILPLCYEAATTTPRPPRQGEKTILWLGQVLLRKGIPYLIEAAKLLNDRPLRFVVAGPIGISDMAVKTAPANMTFLGPVTRDRVGELYSSADLFVLPTLSDGFAITQLEAMAHGLPVITTPNCGDVVTDGVDGRIVPAGNAHALAEAIDTLTADPQQLYEMSKCAIQTVANYSLKHLAERLQKMIDDSVISKAS